MKTSITITAGGGRSCDVAVETGTPYMVYIEAQTETGTPYMVYIAACVCLCQLRARGSRPADSEGPAAVVRHHRGPDGDGHPLYGLHHRACVCVSYEREGRGRRTVRAQQLWYAIIEAQTETGTPYMLYKDACNSKSNQQNIGTIKCSNLCTEVVEYSSAEEVSRDTEGGLAHESSYALI